MDAIPYPAPRTGSVVSKSPTKIQEVVEIAQLLAQVADPFPSTFNPLYTATPTTLSTPHHNLHGISTMPVSDFSLADSPRAHQVPQSPELDNGAVEGAPALPTLPALSTIAGLGAVDFDPVNLVPVEHQASPANSPYTSSQPPTPDAETEEDEALHDQETSLQRMTVEALRAELRSRGASASGRKTELQNRLRRLLKRRGAKPVGTRSARRASSATTAARKEAATPYGKRKRPHTRKEPGRDDFSTEEEYQAAWARDRKSVV